MSRPGDAPRIVYVEDDELSRTVMTILLREIMGFQDLTIWENSADFIARLDRLAKPPTVFFLDIQVGPHDGYELLKMLRADARFKESTVIAMTANVMSHDVGRLRDSGFSGLIGKPIVQEVFPQLIDKILAGESVWYIP